MRGERGLALRKGIDIGIGAGVMAAIAMVMMTATGCFSPAYEQPRCGAEGECPSGLTCANDVCVADPTSDGAMPDAGADAGTDAGVDAPLAMAFPSCVGLAKTCGANGTGDCCESPLVPGGTFFRTYDVAGDGLSGTTNLPAAISSFRLDKYPITVGRFRAFVAAGKGIRTSPPADGAGELLSIPGSGWNIAWTVSLAPDQVSLLNGLKCGSTFSTWTDAPGNGEARPLNCLNWYEAMAFCIWDGGHLVTENEWNYAVAGGNEHRAYPWSVPPGLLSIDNTRANYNCMGDGVAGCTAADIPRVGNKPAGDGRWGHSDLNGTLYDWVLDGLAATPVPCVDCGILGSEQQQLVRGTYYGGSEQNLRLYIRSSTSRSAHNNVIGARCARPAQ